MRNSSKILLNKYQTRKTTKQKIEFRAWLTNYANELGYSVEYQRYNKKEKGVNIIIGNVEHSDIIISAHYDTQPNFFIPIFMFVSNWFSFILSQIATIIPIIFISFIVPFLVAFITKNATLSLLAFHIIVIVFLFQMIIGIANKHTANDNTSGVATLLAIMEDLPKDKRNQIAFVFFDQEELGLIGSSAFKKKYKHIIDTVPLFNFDCVSDGDFIFFIAKKKFNQSNMSLLLEKSFPQNIKINNKQIRLASANKFIYTSDQIIFKNSVGIAALKKMPILGYYLDRIHTSRDINFDSENIELLTSTMITLINQIN